MFSRNHGPRQLSLPMVWATQSVILAAAIVVATAAVDLWMGEPDDESPASRRLFALPNVTDLDFQDMDLDVLEVGGNVSWAPPADTTEVSGYVVYLADASDGSASRVYLGTADVMENRLAVPFNTSLANRSHVFVHTRSVHGISPHGVGYQICDINVGDSLFLVNEAPTASTWAITDLAFYQSVDCTGEPLRWAIAGSSGASELSREAANAFDGDTATAWESSCNSCPTGRASIGIQGVCNAEEVRCVRIRQCGGSQLAGAGCPANSGRAHRISLLVRGEEIHRWKNLPTDDLQGKLRQETLVVTGRRRRAFAGHASESTLTIEHTTSTGFTSR